MIVIFRVGSPTHVFLLGFGDKTDAEIDGFVSETVLFHQIGTAAGGTNAVLPVIHAQDSAAGLLQLEAMALSGQFLLSIVGCIETKALRADKSYAQILTFQHSVVAIAVGTVLLGTDIIFMQAGNGVGKQAVPCGVALINIVLHGTQAVVGDILQTLWQEHS